MNPHTGQFEPVVPNLPPEDERHSWPKFEVGEEIEIKGHTFVIRKITKKDLVLRPKR